MNYNPLSPAVQDNPHPYYAELRDKAPAAWIESMHAWAVSRYADVDFILRNPRLVSSASKKCCAMILRFKPFFARRPKRSNWTVASYPLTQLSSCS